jgi:Zn-dependent peptidase ImmA (M78 family)
MRVKLPKNFNPMYEVFQLTQADIEAQVMEDLIRYKKLYFSKYRKIAPAVLDVDNFVQELWGVSIEFGKIAQPGVDNLILGKLEPENQKIIVDTEARSVARSISFTIGHEAGHLSLHASMFRIEGGQVKGWADNGRLECENKRKEELNHKRREWQANHYAGSLLAPKIELENLLKQLGLVSDRALVKPVDLAVHGENFISRFGLSRQALEIRLSELSIPVINAKYPRFNK